MQIALELIEQIRGKQGVNGIHLMAVGWEEIVPRIVTEAGLLPLFFFKQAAISNPVPNLGDSRAINAVCCAIITLWLTTRMRPHLPLPLSLKLRHYASNDASSSR